MLRSRFLWGTIMRTSTRIGIQPGTKALRLERNPFGSRPIIEANRHYHFEPGSWCLWINTHDFTQGTYLKLYDDGMVERVTLHADGREECNLIKPKDGE